MPDGVPHLRGAEPGPLVVAATVGVIRMLPLPVPGRLGLPPLLLRSPGFVSVAVLSALLARERLVSGGQVTLPPAHPQLLAALPAFLVAARTRSLTATVLAGIAAMALLRRWL